MSGERESPAGRDEIETHRGDVRHFTRQRYDAQTGWGEFVFGLFVVAAVEQVRDGHLTRHFGESANEFLDRFGGADGRGFVGHFLEFVRRRFVVQVK